MLGQIVIRLSSFVFRGDLGEVKPGIHHNGTTTQRFTTGLWISSEASIARSCSTRRHKEHKDSRRGAEDFGFFRSAPGILVLPRRTPTNLPLTQGEAFMDYDCRLGGGGLTIVEG